MHPFMTKPLAYGLISLSTLFAGRMATAETLSPATYFASQNRFCHELLAEAVQEGRANENLFLSPLSAHLALSMLLEGAQGATRAGMLESFHLPVDLEASELHQLNSDYMASLAQASEGVQISIHNAVWTDQSFPLAASFVDRLRHYYQAPASNGDFRHDAVAMASEMNTWAQQSTHGKIRQIITPDVVVGLEMLLANASYFKGTWQQEFAKAKTVQGAFTSELATSPVAMMHGVFKAAYAADGYQAIRLPYKGEAVAMYVVLPPADSEARAWAASTAFTDAFWQDVDTRFVSEKVNLALPKFRLEASKYLNEALIKLGMADIFVQPNFAGLSDVASRVSFVKQDSFIQVDEEGTEAAAVTSIGVERTTIVRQPKVMQVDRPFVVAIRDEKHKSLLFAGYIANPIW